MKKLKKLLGVTLSVCLVSGYSFSVSADDDETVIVMTETSITVNGDDISDNENDAVYVSTKIENHSDVPEDLKNTENTVITITKGGKYRFSGTISDAQIAVSAPETDNVDIILDNVGITCQTAPAILVYSAAEPAEVGKAGVTITLADNSINEVNGSHTAATQEDQIKHDGAISSNVSLLINGSGSLTVNGDMEGIEVKYKHLTIDDGTFHIYSNDDPINGSEDGVAHITINGGYVYCNAVGAEGDGIDSNGYITINGGTVIALASPNSMDSGIDSDMGSVINGGTVVGAGNMFDEIDDSSSQLYMFMQFSEATDDLICVTDSLGNPVFAYDFPFDYSYISFSCPELTENTTYNVYIGGTVEGDESDGLYTNIVSYSPGNQMHHGGTSQSQGNNGGMTPPDGVERPEGGMTPPDGVERPEGGMTPPDGMERPEGGMMPPDGNETSASENGNWYDDVMSWALNENIAVGDEGSDVSAEQSLTREMMMLFAYRYVCHNGVELENVSDLSEYNDSGIISDYAREAVEYLVGEGLIEGGDGLLRPADTLTRAEAVTIVLRIIDRSGIGTMTAPQKAPGEFGGSGEISQGTYANIIEEDGTKSGESYVSTGDDENALRIDGADVTLDGINVNKSDGASSNTEDGDFYGQNAALLATNGANVVITNSEINSSVTNGNGVFSYGEGTSVTISDSSITTIGDHSGGIHTTGGGAMNAKNLDINTDGSSSAAIRTDRGGGTVDVNGGTYTTNGYNSPAIYSTAAITASDCTLTANNSEALIIEGKNSIKLKDCDVSGNMSDTNGTSSDENVHNIMIYQSMSGDAEVGLSSFSMEGGSITNNNGDMIYVTNTNSVVELSDVDIINNESDGYLIRVCGNSGERGWGKAGANGGSLQFTADNQVLNGDIIVDTISTIDMHLTGNSVFSGTVNIVENEQNGSAVGENAVISIDEGSVWNLTGNCTVTSVENNGTINFNGYSITMEDGTVLSQ